MASWFVWVLAAGLLTLLEISVPTGFVFLCFAVACLVTAGVSLVSGSFALQLAAFSVATTACFVAVRPFFQRYMQPRGGPVRTNVHALLDQQALVTAEVTALGGQVKVRGEEWAAVSDGPAAIPVGTTVRVIAVSGNRLSVAAGEKG
jgi:membrane protein implicated in regulation of membrane protease activity